MSASGLEYLKRGVMISAANTDYIIGEEGYQSILYTLFSAYCAVLAVAACLLDIVVFVAA
jgi:hypothetical protein